MAQAPGNMRRARPLLGTFVEICASGAAPAILEAAIEEAFGAVARVHRLMSFQDAASDVSRLNREAATRETSVDSWTYEVLEAALDLYRQSGGIFDITSGPASASRASNRGKSPGETPATASPLPEGEGQGEGLYAKATAYNPSPGPQAGRPLPMGEAALRRDSSGSARTFAAATRAKDATSAVELRADYRVRFHHPHISIDLSGIAKGFAVDRAIDALKRFRLLSGLVNAGGDLAAFGPAPYSVHIRDPRLPSQLLCAVNVDNEALASSGASFDLLQSFDIRDPAIIDPKTQAPVRAIAGATVRARSCIMADALTKVVMIAGEAAGSMLGHYGAEALIVWAGGSVSCSSGWGALELAA